jgi:hypothetical protein
MKKKILLVSLNYSVSSSSHIISLYFFFKRKKKSFLIHNDYNFKEKGTFYIKKKKTNLNNKNFLLKIFAFIKNTLLNYFKFSHKLYFLLENFALGSEIYKKKNILSKTKLRFFYDEIKKKIDINEFEKIICFEPDALIVIKLLVKNSKVKIIYNNLELPTENFRPINREYIRYYEKIFVNTTPLIIQNEKRGLLYNRLIKNKKKKLLYCPVSTIKVSESSVINFKKKIGLTKKDILVGYFGNVSNDFDILNLIKASKSLSNNHYVLISSWQKQIIKKLKKIPSKNIYFLTQELQLKDIQNYIRSLDMGLIINSDKDDNYKEIAFSSNKLAEYTLAKLPVLYTPNVSINELNNKFRFGVEVKNFDNLSKYINKINIEKKIYKKNSQLVFNRYYDGKKNFKVFLND